MKNLDIIKQWKPSLLLGLQRLRWSEVNMVLVNPFCIKSRKAKVVLPGDNLNNQGHMATLKTIQRQKQFKKIKK